MSFTDTQNLGVFLFTLLDLENRQLISLDLGNLYLQTFVDIVGRYTYFRLSLLWSDVVFGFAEFGSLGHQADAA